MRDERRTGVRDGRVASGPGAAGEPPTTPPAGNVTVPPELDAAVPAWLAVLLAPGGRRLLAGLPDGALSTAETLRLAETLRAAWPVEVAAAALTLRELRVTAAGKFGRAGMMWFTRDGLEQASSERMARHHAARYDTAGCGRVADLCTGIGGDLLALVAGRHVVAVDLDPVHLRMAVENAAVHGSGAVEPVLGDVATVPLDGVDGVFVDPARRAGGRRLPAGTSLPPLGWCLELARRVPAVGIKAAPGLPLELVPGWRDGDRAGAWEVEFVSEGRDLKEAALWSPALATTRSRATLLPDGATLTGDPDVPGAGDVPVAPPGAWLLDPDPAVTRAGLVGALARATGAWKIDGQIAFLSANRPVRTPFARLLAVEASLPWHLKRLREVLRERGIGAVDVRKRGSAVDVDDLRRRLRLTGERGAVVVLTRVADRPWALVCTLA